MSDIWRKRYERERRARQEAEQLLEDKSLELYELNQQQAGEIRQRQKFDVYLLGTARSLLAASVSSPFDSIRANFTAAPRVLSLNGLGKSAGALA